MKHISYILNTILLISLFIQLYSCRDPNQGDISNIKDVIINGNLSHLNDGTQIILKYKDLISGEWIQRITVPSDDCKFQFQISKYNVQDIEIKIKDQIIPLLIFPGENIQVQIKDSNFEEPVQFIGSKAKFNTEFYMLNKALNKYIFEIDSTEYYIKIKTPKDYKTYVINIEKKLFEFVDDYSKINSIKSKISNWHKLFIHYKTANHLIYPYNIKSKQFNLENNYWDFFNNYPINNENAISCSEYYQYCINYFIYLGQIENRFSNTNQYYGKDWGKYYKMIIKEVNTIMDGIASDIIISNNLYRFMQEDIALFGEAKNQISNNIRNLKIRQLILQKYDFLNERIININVSEGIKIYDYRKDTSNIDILNILISKYKNNVIYIDNWASWCGPCIVEMPYSVDLQRQYKNKSIVFVFICNPDNYVNDRAKSIISENQVTGEHYFMSFKQSYLMQIRFKRNGIPRYMIINKEGEIIDNDAPRPSSKQIRNVLNKLLE